MEVLQKMDATLKELTDAKKQRVSKIYRKWVNLQISEKNILYLRISLQT